jgi:hypothetical protein
LRTSQFGFIPANLFCICVYSFSIRSWLKEKHNTGDRAQQNDRWFGLSPTSNQLYYT